MAILTYFPFLSFLVRTLAPFLIAFSNAAGMVVPLEAEGVGVQLGLAVDAGGFLIAVVAPLLLPLAVVSPGVGEFDCGIAHAVRAVLVVLLALRLVGVLAALLRLEGVVEHRVDEVGAVEGEVETRPVQRIDRPVLMIRQKLAHLRFAELQIVVDGAVEMEAESSNVITNRRNQDSSH